MHFTFCSVCCCLPHQFFHRFPHGISRKKEHPTAGVYLYMAAHITQFKILHRAFLLLVLSVPTLPVPTVSQIADTINRTFKCFGRFLRKIALGMDAGYPGLAFAHQLLRGSPLSHGFAVPALPKGEPLTFRKVSRYTKKLPLSGELARRNATRLRGFFRFALLY